MIVLLTLLQLVWLQFQPESGLCTLAANTRHPQKNQSVVLCKVLDRVAGWAGRGNVFLKLEGCSRTNLGPLSSHVSFGCRETYLSEWYFRDCYSLYPRRLFLAPTNVIVNDGWDMMKIKFAPVPAWLQARDVRSILTLGFDNRGRTLPVQWKPLKSAAFGIKTQTNRTGGNR